MEKMTYLQHPSALLKFKIIFLRGRNYPHLASLKNDKQGEVQREYRLLTAVLPTDTQRTYLRGEEGTFTIFFSS